MMRLGLFWCLPPLKPCCLVFQQFKKHLPQGSTCCFGAPVAPQGSVQACSRATLLLQMINQHGQTVAVQRVFFQALQHIRCILHHLLQRWIGVGLLRDVGKQHRSNFLELQGSPVKRLDRAKFRFNYSKQFSPLHTSLFLLSLTKCPAWWPPRRSRRRRGSPATLPPSCGSAAARRSARWRRTAPRSPRAPSPRRPGPSAAPHWRSELAGGKRIQTIC